MALSFFQKWKSLIFTRLLIDSNFAYFRNLEGWDWHVASDMEAQCTKDIRSDLLLFGQNCNLFLLVFLVWVFIFTRALWTQLCVFDLTRVTTWLVFLALGRASFSWTFPATLKFKIALSNAQYIWLSLVFISCSHGCFQEERCSDRLHQAGYQYKVHSESHTLCSSLWTFV